MNGDSPNDLQFVEASMLSRLPNAGQFGGIRNHFYFTGNKQSASSHSASSGKHK
jgi:hypothetical protein